MNYINKDKNYMTDAERIRYLEESIRELRKEKENLKKEKGELKARLVEENKELKERIRFLEECLDNKEKVNKSLREELEWYYGFDNYLTNHGFDMKNLKEERDNFMLKYAKTVEEKVVETNKLYTEMNNLKSELEIWKLTAKDYAKQCGVELDDNIKNQN